MSGIAPVAETLFLGLWFVDGDAAVAAALIAGRPDGAPFAYVVTPNADHFVRLRRTPGLRDRYDQAEWRFLDSVAIAHAARLLGLRPPRVATGADVNALVLSNYLRRDDRLTVIGLENAGAEALRRDHPTVVLSHHRPPFGLVGDAAGFAAAVAFAVAHPARFTLLAVGSPVQERLAAAIQATGAACGTGLCIGAAVEFWAGLTPRAPPALRRLGLEWLYRLWREPRRLWRRYLLRDWAIIALLLAARLR
ncbi:WecB/TagA/CpsF family glycosyltransferase [Acidisoma cladoniae]|jgi:N-acetylglucosaminyldiphosphoundecaprenol N-acetyl-beta-D-mannosaminyltransferase|uniref:WecB/TagA/CpsF family glycosyltransferase n=1 Tax=Acidisoma cladoniae TaxID=3040935 RepID=UPI0025506F6F|nr:WecB/TagA/CpsF family glycosyltransferase [Acidisoma sp. PAMC 29798]